MERLGYERYGPFRWLKGHDTDLVTRNVGATPFLWVETEHFKIGSSLTTYEYSGDRDERERLEEELDRLRDRLGDLDAPRRELDPWLRLHLYAQRIEDAYAAFHEDFGLEPADYADLGPYLGQERKLCVLLCERQSEYGRHAREYLDVQNDTSYRFGWSGTTMGFATSAEHLRRRFYGSRTVPFDTVLANSLLSALGQVFLDAYRQNDYGSPEWLKRGYSHVLWRRFDDGWVTDAGYGASREVGDDDHEWPRRVRNLVENDFFASTADMFAWERGDLNIRDHMVAWSKLDYLLSEVEGDHAAFLRQVAVRAPKGTPEQVRERRVAIQNRALKDCFDLAPAELDEAWAEWVEDEYPRR